MWAIVSHLAALSIPFVSRKCWRAFLFSSSRLQVPFFDISMIEFGEIDVAFGLALVSPQNACKLHSQKQHVSVRARIFMAGRDTVLVLFGERQGNTRKFAPQLGLARCEEETNNWCRAPSTAD